MNIFAYNNQDSTLNDNPPYFNGFLKLKSWDFASMLGLGTPCEPALIITTPFIVTPFQMHMVKDLPMCE